MRGISRFTACCLVLLLCSSSSFAATLCGTVRDAVTHDPVSGAGVFVYDTQGVYTEHWVATDEQGAFCLDELATGIYDLRVLVDDYQAYWMPDVSVQEGQSAVDILLPPGACLFPPVPNPAVEVLSIRYRAPSVEPVRLAILDVTGRWVRGWARGLPGTARVAERAHAPAEVAMIEGTVSWDLRDSAGRRVAPGSYYVCFEAAGVADTFAILVVR